MSCATVVPVILVPACMQIPPFTVWRSQSQDSGSRVLMQSAYSAILDHRVPANSNGSWLSWSQCSAERGHWPRLCGSSALTWVGHAAILMILQVNYKFVCSHFPRQAGTKLFECFMTFFYKGYLAPSNLISIAQNNPAKENCLCKHTSGCVPKLVILPMLNSRCF